MKILGIGTASKINLNIMVPIDNERIFQTDHFSVFIFTGILRYNSDVPEPVMLTMVSELSSFGFFQRGT